MLDPVEQLMAGIFKVPAEKIPDDATIGGVDQWVSMYYGELMMALEGEFSMTVSTGQVLELMSLKSIVGFVCESPMLGKLYGESHTNGDLSWWTTMGDYGDSS